LTATQLHRRLQTGDERGLYVAPLLPPALSGSGVDLRLGSQFIVFQRIGTWAIDPVYGRADPRSMQCLVEKAWGEQFVLHPGELVLASTLEYLVMPADLAGQVVTRSSYGRLGLTTASAVLVQPGFRGCLTLGLVNLGGVPIQLTPGERIAQLIVHTAMPRQAETSEKYDCPTGPEFSRVSMDPDAVVLQEMRRTAGLAGARAPAGPWWR
jgi:deoxycytidine triphosphate deaminase